MSVILIAPVLASIYLLVFYVKYIKVEHVEEENPKTA